MNRLVRIEFLKLRTTPAIWITLVLTALLSAVPAAVTILFAGHGENPPLDSVETIASVFAVGAFTSVAMLVMGILIAAGEDRHRTNLATFLGEPRRERVLAAKMLAAGVLGAAVGAFAFGLAAAVGFPSSRPKECTTCTSTSSRWASGRWPSAPATDCSAWPWVR